MNKLLALGDDEIEAVIQMWVERIGHGDDGLADRAVTRIKQLEAAKRPDMFSDEWNPDPALIGERAA